MERQEFRCLKSPFLHLLPAAWNSGKYQSHNTSQSSQTPQGTFPHFKESVSIKKWLYRAQTSLLWINLGGEGGGVGGGENIEALALNISEILKAQINLWKYQEVVSCLRNAHMCRNVMLIPKKSWWLMADNENILFLLDCILVVFIAQNCVLLPKSPWWGKGWKFLLKLILKL